jgi:hypothetical protein
LADFRRRLARKASTISLRSKRRDFEVKGKEQRQVKAEERSNEGRISDVNVKQQFEAPDRLREEFGREAVHRLGELEVERSPITITSQSTAASETEEKEFTTSGESVQAFTNLSKLGSSDYEVKPDSNQNYQQVYRNSRKMASDHATPPVPYTRLKEITENVSSAR